MKVLFSILLIIVNINCFSQLNKNILGSWIKVAIESNDGIVVEQIEDESLGYFKYTFFNDGNLNISVHYSSNGTNQKYLIRNNIIELIFNRKFLIEKTTEDSLILVELENGNLTVNSNKHKFIREQKYLDMLSVAPDDKIEVENDTVYFESEKLYPRFKNKLYNNDCNNYFAKTLESYLKQEVYAYATFVIYPNREIKNINIFHHFNKTFDNKFVKAIQKTKKCGNYQNAMEEKFPF